MTRPRKFPGLAPGAARSAGVRARQARGLPVGRPRLEVSAEDVRLLRALGLTWAEVADRLGCSERTAFARLAEGRR